MVTNEAGETQSSVGTDADPLGKYHGLYYAGISIITMQRSFYCDRWSQVNVRYAALFCSAGPSDLVQLYLDSQTHLIASIEGGSQTLNSYSASCSGEYGYNTSVFNISAYTQFKLIFIMDGNYPGVDHR